MLSEWSVRPIPCMKPWWLNFDFKLTFIMQLIWRWANHLSPSQILFSGDLMMPSLGSDHDSYRCDVSLSSPTLRLISIVTSFCCKKFFWRVLLSFWIYLDKLIQIVWNSAPIVSVFSESCPVRILMTKLLQKFTGIFLSWRLKSFKLFQVRDCKSKLVVHFPDAQTQIITQRLY